MSHSQDATRPMAEDALESLVGRVADDYLARVQRGETPDAEEYAARHPHAAALIRRTLAALALAGDSLGGGQPTVADPALPEALGDFRLVREVGRGGMGVVYEAEQLSLRRRVAMKVLPFAAVMDPRHVQRFRNEALAAASLDHPHVVKVYGVGCERGTQFIALQFVDGRPLSDLIRARRGGVTARGADATVTVASDRTDTPAARPASTCSRTPGDRAYYRQVAGWGADAADALEHAHALGVVHRDVKPGNLLVDGAGAVYVADFGLAKLTADPGVTGTGDLLGTVRYMSPEQAAAKHDLVDHRTDIYSLGVTLYELLALAPAFAGADRQAVLSAVLTSDPAALRAHDRGVPRDLATVVQKAMEKDPARRYQTAGELAADLRRFIADQAVRAKPVTRGERAMRTVRRHPYRAAAVVVAVLLAGVGLAYWGHLRAADAAAAGERAERVESDATLLADEAERLLNTGRHSEALAVATRAADRLGESRNSALRQRVSALVTDLTLALRLNELLSDYCRAVITDSPAAKAAVASAFDRAFADSGVDVLGGDEGEVAAALRRSVVPNEITAALWAWSELGADPKRLARLADAVDPAPGEAAALIRRTPASDKPCLRDIVAQTHGANLPTAALGPLTLRLMHADLWDEAAHLLRAAVAVRPGDYWTYRCLGMVCRLTEDRLRFLTAARALRPTDAINIHDIGRLLFNSGKLVEAEGYFREAIRLDPVLVDAHDGLGLALRDQGKAAEAEACFREVARLKPNDPSIHYVLGHLFRQQKRFAAAEQEYREALRLEPKLGQGMLGSLLLEVGRYEEAAACFQADIRRSPDYYDSHHRLGHAFLALNRLGDAVKEYREAIRLAPEYALLHWNLGVALERAGKPNDALKSYEEAIRLDPNRPEWWAGVGNTLSQLGQNVQAESYLQKAVSLNPAFAEAHCRLGDVLTARGKFHDAVAAYRQGHDLGVKRPGWAYPSAEWVRRAERRVVWDEKLPAVASGQIKPEGPDETVVMAEVAHIRKWYAAADRLLGDALAVDPKLGGQVNGVRYNAACAAVLAGCGRGDDPVRPSDEERKQLRGRGLQGLKAELAGIAQLGEHGATADQLVPLLRHWHTDPDLAPVRDAAGLVKLPETERAEWQKLWVEMAELEGRLRTRSNATPAGREVTPPPRPDDGGRLVRKKLAGGVTFPCGWRVYPRAAFLAPGDPTCDSPPGCDRLTPLASPPPLGHGWGSSGWRPATTRPAGCSTPPSAQTAWPTLGPCRPSTTWRWPASPPRRTARY